MKSILAATFARGGSKGIPGKNIRLLGGIPLVGWAVKAALASRYVSEVIVSTDDEEIAAIARDAGALTPFIRPADLARDDTPEWLAWQHAIAWMMEKEGRQREFFLSVPATAPLRLPEDIDRCLERLFEGDCDIVITVCEAQRNPYFNMVTVDSKGFARLAAVPEVPVHRRQDAPSVYEITTVAYAARSCYVMEATGLFQGKIATVVVPRERSLDIDSPSDFALAENAIQAGSFFTK